jgi:nucleoside-diphosphate-sugar epimerase
MDAYGRSKVLAERAAWEFAEREGLELTTMLPVAVMGPVTPGGAGSGANHIVAAMTVPEAAGQRFLLSTGPVVPMRETGAILRSHLGPAASRVPTRTIPNVVVRLGARFNPQFRAIAGELGYRKKISNAKARRVLGWEPRPSAQAIIAAGETLGVRATRPVRAQKAARLP